MDCVRSEIRCRPPQYFLAWWPHYPPFVAQDHTTTMLLG